MPTVKFLIVFGGWNVRWGNWECRRSITKGSGLGWNFSTFYLAPHKVYRREIQHTNSLNSPCYSTTIQNLLTLLMGIAFLSILFWALACFCFRKKVCCEIFIKTFFHHSFFLFIRILMISMNNTNLGVSVLFPLFSLSSSFSLYSIGVSGYAGLCAVLWFTSDLLYASFSTSDELNEPLILPAHERSLLLIAYFMTLNRVNGTNSCDISTLKRRFHWIKIFWVTKFVL